MAAASIAVAIEEGKLLAVVDSSSFARVRLRVSLVPPSSYLALVELQSPCNGLTPQILAELG